MSCRVRCKFQLESHGAPRDTEKNCGCGATAPRPRFTYTNAGPEGAGLERLSGARVAGRQPECGYSAPAWLLGGALALGLLAPLACGSACGNACGNDGRAPERALPWNYLDLQLMVPADFTQNLQNLSDEIPEPWRDEWRAVSQEVRRVRFVRSGAATTGPQSRGAGSGPIIEVTVDRAPGLGNLAAAVSLIQHLTYGPSYRHFGADMAVAGGRHWVRTQYQYTITSNVSGVTKIGVVEYASAWRNKMYRVGFHGWDESSASRISAIMNRARIGIRSETTSASALFSPEDSIVSSSGPRPGRPDAVSRAVESVVVLVVGTSRDQYLHVASGGSGIVVSSDGAILSNLHVVLDEEREQLYDVFFVGRTNAATGGLEFICAGQPGRGRFEEWADLALLRCDRPLSGNGPRWPRAAQVAEVEPALQSRVYVAGYPDTGYGRLTVGAGVVTGWAKSSERDLNYLRTDAGISAGVSGGAAFSATGQIVGVASGYRYRAHRRDPQSAVVVERVGLIQPIAHAQRLFELATNGWAIGRDPRTP